MTIKQDFRHADQLWGYIEGKLYCNVPKYIKNLLRVRGLDDPASLQSIDDDIIKQLEVFVKNGGLTPFIPNSATNLKDFFGIFHQFQQDFEILPGHKVCIKFLENVDYLSMNESKLFKNSIKRCC